jgi:hypothetical protein
MENDSIRASGTDTLVDIWIDGKMRSISISQEAIGAYLDFDRVARMSEDERCEVIKNNLAVVLKAAKARLREGDPTIHSIVLDAGHLPRPDGKSTDRRRGDRRKGDRRKGARPLGTQAERRRTDRRTGERRTRKPKTES